MKILHLASAVLVAVLMAGCDSGDRVFDSECTAWSEASVTRRKEFAEAMVAAMRDFDDLYGSRIIIEVIEISPGNPTVTVRARDKKLTGELERPVSVAVTNFSMKYPGICFMMDENESWRVICPDDMRIPVSGDFKLKFP